MDALLAWLSTSSGRWLALVVLICIAALFVLAMHWGAEIQWGSFSWKAKP